MSGFFGVARDNAEPFDPQTFSAFAKRLESRGPGITSIWSRQGRGLCYAAIRSGPGDQRAETQPATLHPSQGLLGDVRLDGKNELAAQLGLSAMDARSKSNNELLLCAWQKWGPGCLQRILGDFSFALWDASENSLWCARDFIGHRPFFYAVASGTLYFSNTLRALRGLPGVSLEFDPIFIGDFLLMGYCADPSRTVYRGIHRLPPAHTLKYSNGHTEVQRFLSLPIEEPLYLKRSDDYLETYLQLVRQAVADRLPEGPAALYLSGGLDSAIVCAMAVELAQSQSRANTLKAFTVGWRPLFDDPEPAFAKMTAEYLGLPHEVLEDSAVLPFEGRFPTPEPSSEFYEGRARKHSVRFAQHAPVVLSGDGGDHILAGQSWPYLQYLGGRCEWGRIVRTLGGFALSHGRIPPLRAGIRVRLRRLFRGDAGESSFPPWISPKLEREANLRERSRELDRPGPAAHPVHPLAYDFLHSGYWSMVLEGEDAGWTGVALEARSPLLDLRLLRFLFRLPPVPWGVNKEIVRKAMKGRLPQAILQRPKTTLRRDPLEAAQTEKAWYPEPAKPASTGIQVFADYSKWNETLISAKGSISWTNLLPAALDYWFKDIEND